MMRLLSYSLLMMALLLTPLMVSAQDPLSNFQDAINELTQSILGILNTLKASAISIGRVMAGTLIALGVVLWASDIFTYKGRKLILAGIILLIVMELIR